MKKFLNFSIAFSFVSFLFAGLFCVYQLIYADEKTYDQRLTIDLYGKTLKEITTIKSEFEKVADKYDLTINIQTISEEEINMRDKWQKMLKEKK